MKVCIYCGLEYPIDAGACEGCGSREFKNKCNNCGEVFSAGMCPKCGVMPGEEPRSCSRCGRKTYEKICTYCNTDVISVLNSDKEVILDEFNKAVREFKDTASAFDEFIKEPQVMAGSLSSPGENEYTVPAFRGKSRTSGQYSSKIKRYDKLAGCVGIFVFLIICAVLIMIIATSTMLEQTGIVYEGQESGSADTWKNYLDMAGGSWVQTDSGWWYKNQDGSYTKDDFQCINGEIYRFNESGYMMTGWQKKGNKSVFMQHDGVMARDMWLTDADGSEYYLQGDGILAVNRYVKAESQQMYYKVDENGARDPDGDRAELEE